MISPSVFAVGHSRSGRRRHRGGSGGLTLEAAPGLVLDLDPSVDASITQSGGFASAIADRSGHGNGASQTYASNQPAVATNAHNGLTVLRFSAASQHYMTGTLAVSEATLFVVGSANSHEQAWFNASPTYQTNNLWQIMEEGLNTVKLRRNSSDAVYSGYAYGEFHVWSATIAATGATLYKDGVQVAQDTSSQALATSAHYVIGGLFNNGQPGNPTQTFNVPIYNLDGDVGRVAVIDHVVSPSDHSTYVNQLKARWGIA